MPKGIFVTFAQKNGSHDDLLLSASHWRSPTTGLSEDVQTFNPLKVQLVECQYSESIYGINVKLLNLRPSAVGRF